MMPSIEALIQDIQRKYLTKVLDNAEDHMLLFRIMEMGRKVRLKSDQGTWKNDDWELYALRKQKRYSTNSGARHLQSTTCTLPENIF